MDWLDVNVKETFEVDLFGDRIDRVVQFRYVSTNDRWHLGRYGRVQYQENYAPFKNDNIWRTPAAQDWRPMMTACDSSERVLHKYPSKVAVAAPGNVNRLCRGCLSELRRLQDELFQKSPEYRRHQMLEKMLRHADEQTRQQLQVECPDFGEAMLNHLRENGPEESYQLACLAYAFGLPDS